MNICFVDGTSIINRVHRIELGKLTCEQLNARGWDAYAGLQAHLDFFFPSDNATASEFLASLEATRSEITRMKTMLASNRYYQLNDEAANTFATIEHLLEDTCQQVQKKMHSGADYVVDLGIEINTTELNVASTYTDTLFATHVNAVRIFTQLVDAIMIQNDAFPQRRAIDRLHAYGFDRFQAQVQELLNESETAASSFTVAQYEDVIEKIKNYIVARSISITSRLNPDMLNDGKIIEDEIDEFFREWEDALSAYAPENFSYGEKYMIRHPDADHGRLLKAYGTDDHNGFDAMTSMRNVDSTVSGNILVWED